MTTEWSLIDGARIVVTGLSNRRKTSGWNGWKVPDERIGLIDRAGVVVTNLGHERIVTKWPKREARRNTARLGDHGRV